MSTLLINGGMALNLLPTHTLAAAETAATTTPIINLDGMKYLTVEAEFIRAAGGTSADFYIQTTFDNGTTWVDIMEFGFTTSTASKIMSVGMYAAIATPTTPSDGALAANTALTGILGTQLRVKYTTVGTYTGASSITIRGVAKN